MSAPIPKEYFIAAQEYAPAVHEISDDLFVECASCGYEPRETSRIPSRPCPKCGSSTWRQVVRPNALAVA